MRKHIDTVRELYEAPYSISGEVDFRLETDRYNIRRRDFIVNSAPVILVDDTTGVLYRLNGTDGGQFCFVSKVTKLIEYYMQCVVEDSATLGRCATQIKVWNRVAPSGLTTRLFWDRLFEEFDTLVSDRSQTKDGEKFWLRRMVEALTKNYRVGMMDGAVMHEYVGPDFMSWIGTLDAWGKTNAHKERRFFISKHTVTKEPTSSLSP